MATPDPKPTAPKNKLTPDRPDPTFGIGAQPLAILQLLADIEPTYADFSHGRYQIAVETFPWYGGVALQVFKDPYPRQALIIAFTENNISDRIEVLHWLIPLEAARSSGPTIDDKPEGVSRRVFPFGDLAAAIPYITGLMQHYYETAK